MNNHENNRRSAWEKVKNGVSSFFFEPIPTTGGTDMSQQSKQSQEPKQEATQNSVRGSNHKTAPQPAAPQKEGFRRKESPVQPPQPLNPAQNTAQPERAYIPKDTVIEGNIVTNSDLHIAGIVNGNVTTEGQLSLSGRIVGDISANTLSLNSGSVNGDVLCAADVQLTNQAVINGNVDAQSLDCNGEIHGDVKTSKTVVLRQNALVCGNIVTKTVNMQDGAILQGHVEMPTDKTSAQIYFKENAAQNGI